MKTVEVVEVRISNFRSIRDERITFPTKPGLRFLGGENVEEPDLGSNGAGKSTIWTAIRWCLYGDGKLSMLTTWGEKETWVEIDLKIGDNLHTVKRWGPPAYLYLDGQRTEQAVVDTLLGLKRLPFQHSVIFHQGYRLFPDLTVPERGELLEEVLGLDFWTKCGWTATYKYTKLEKDQQPKKVELAGIQGQLKGLATEAEIQAKIDEWQNEYYRNISNYKLQSANWEAGQAEKVVGLMRQSDAWIAKWEKDHTESLEWSGAELEKTESKLKELEAQLVYTDRGPEIEGLKSTVLTLEGRIRTLSSDVATKESKVAGLKGTLQTMKTSGTCPTCGQTLKGVDPAEIEGRCTDVEVNIWALEEQINTHRKELGPIQVEVEQTRNSYSSVAAQVASERVRIEGVNEQVAYNNARIRQLEADCRVIVGKLENPDGNNPYEFSLQSAQKEVNPYPELIRQAEEKKNPYILAMNELQQRRTALLSEESMVAKAIETIDNSLAAVEFWKQGFKRIRLYLTNRVLSALTVEINAAINTLGMKGWSVELSTETETKSGTVKLGVQIQVKSPKSEAVWESWSGGESQRLRLAMAQGLASLIQRAAGSWWTFEVWDEPTQFLSTEGVEDLLTLLQYRAEQERKTIWLCDHSAIQFAGFEDEWKAVKTTEGTKILGRT